MLKNNDEITCVNAAVALWKIDRQPKAVPALLEMLRHGDPPRRMPWPSPWVRWKKTRKRPRRP